MNQETKTLIIEAYNQAVKDDHTFLESEARLYHDVIRPLYQVIRKNGMEGLLN